jgi:hypothetical protein
VPVAVKGVIVPKGTVSFTGVTAIDCKTAAVTVREPVPDMPPTVAVMVTGLAFATKPLAKPPAATVATDAFDEDQVAVAVRF